MFKKNPTIQTYLSNNKNATIFDIPIDTLKKINTFLESNLLREFYNEECNLKESRPKPKLPDGIGRSSL